LVEPIEGYYRNEGGTITLHSYPEYRVCCWIQIPRGADGDVQDGQIEDMRLEITRIITANKDNVSPFELLVPRDRGKPVHETNVTPKLLRYEITVMGALNQDA
jgi:hypothetical protein